MDVLPDPSGLHRDGSRKLRRAFCGVKGMLSLHSGCLESMPTGQHRDGYWPGGPTVTAGGCMEIAFPA